MTLLRAGHVRQGLVAEAVASMLAARVRTLILPFPRVSRGFGTFVAPTDARVAAQTALRTPERARQARRIGWAIRAAAPYMPFRAVCLQQAMAGHAMLRRRGIATVMHFGAGRRRHQRGIATIEDAALEGHAWLEAEGTRVTGYPVAADLAEIACFVQPDPGTPA